MERKWICLGCGFEATRLQLLVRSDACVRCGHGTHAPRYLLDRMRTATRTVYTLPGSVIVARSTVCGEENGPDRTA